jgi:hypothetical protein
MPAKEKLSNRVIENSTGDLGPQSQSKHPK